MTPYLETWGFDLRTAEGYQAWRDAGGRWPDETRERMERRILEEYEKVKASVPPPGPVPAPEHAAEESAPPVPTESARENRRRHWGVAKLVRHRPLEPAFLGSSPSAPAISSTAVRSLER